MPDLPPIARAILNEVLTRAEQPDRRQVVRVRLNERAHTAYFASDDSAPRHATNAALQQLAAEGVLRLSWRRWEENNWLDSVDLVPEHTAQLYTLLGRTPRQMQDDTLRQLLLAQPCHPGWHADFITWSLARLDMHRSVEPLERKTPTANADLLRALATLPTLTTPTLERLLSVQLFGDSKRLAALRSDILRVLRRHDPAATAFDDDDWALLRAHHLDRVPEYVPLAGKITIRTPAHMGLLDLAGFMPSVALSAAMLRDVTVTAIAARAAITVENATSFCELTLLRQSDVVAIYTGGFASPTTIDLLRAIRAADADVPFFHWGDMDAGGLRILAHLRTQVGTVAPLAMNPATFAAQQAHAQPLTEEDQLALTTLREHPALADCLPLIGCLLASGQKLEQEAVSAATALALLPGQASR